MTKHYLSRMIGYAVLALASAGLGGCPSPVLQVTPGALDFGSSTETSIRIGNIGSGSLSWTLTEVSRLSPESPWVEGDLPWLSAESISGVLSPGLQTVKLEADTALLPVGTTTNVGVRVTSNGGVSTIPLSITVEPTLITSPSTLNLAPASTTATFTVSNIGNTAAAWTVLFLPDTTNTASATALPGDFTVVPAQSTTPPNSSTTVNVSWTTERESFALFVQSAAGSSIVRFNIGQVLTSLTVDPQQIDLFYNNQPPTGGAEVEQVSSVLRINNTTGSAIAWTLEAVTRADSTQPAPISLSPTNGSAPGLGTSEVQVSISSTATPENVLSGSGNYELVLRSGTGFIIVPVTVELLTLPVIAISEPPSPTAGRPEIVALDLLDFGREGLQDEFWIANVGPRASRLFFRITHEDQGVANPVIASVEPLVGNANGPDEDFFFPGENFLIDGVPITVTINRANLVNEVEFRTITIEATNDDNTSVLGPVEKKTVQVRIERAPLTIEGAINRSRPPFLLRFVFLLRDSLGKVIPASEEGVLERLKFTIAENDRPLDVNETNFFVEGPEGLKTNLVLLLDYTGSMLRAGTQDPQNPIAPGVAVAQVKEAARSFIKDLPEGYRLQLMFYNDRQQRDRLIHPFSSDRDSLISALDAFTLPESLFGVSTIRDALADAINALAAEDAGDTLPFDEADVRSVLFITDGIDNASIATEGDIETLADESRVRLYPLLYSAGGQTGVGDMLVLAENSGGHLYAAPRVPDLVALLANRTGIELGSGVADSVNAAQITIKNESAGELAFTTTVIESGGFINQVSPASDSLIAGATANLDITLDPAGLVPGDPVLGQIRIDTNPDTGSGFVTLTATPTLSGGNVVILPENITLAFRDPLGEVWRELSNQVVMTYVTPSQTGGDYNIQVSYQVDPTRTISGEFEEDGVFAPGDVLAGQIALSSSGITVDPNAPLVADRTRAEIYVRADYVPRDVTSFRMRFVLSAPDGVPAGAAAALAQATTTVELAPDGLLIAEDEFSSSWRLLAEGDGIFRMRTEGTNDLLYGSFGRLLKVTVNNLGPYVAAFAGNPRQPEFLFEMRVDNDEYFLPAGGGLPSRTKYFLYPGGPAFVDEGADFPGNRLSVFLGSSSLAGPAPNAARLQNPGFDPELAFPWDLDEDGIGDFQDPEPLNAAIPSALVLPNTFEIGPTVNQFTLQIRNNRLDTFTWAVDNDSLPSWISSITFGSGPGSLAPGASDTINVTVNRAGFSDVVLSGTLTIVTDLFGDEEVELTMVVPPAK